MRFNTINRSLNVSSSERSLLLGVIASHMQVLDARDNDNQSLRQKSLLWDRITSQYNAVSQSPRTKTQIQTLYKNMKAKAKKYQQRLCDAQMDSYNDALPDPDPVSELLLQLLETEHEQRRQQLKKAAVAIAEAGNSVPESMKTCFQFSTQQVCQPIMLNEGSSSSEAVLKVESEDDSLENEETGKSSTEHFNLDNFVSSIKSDPSDISVANMSHCSKGDGNQLDQCLRFPDAKRQKTVDQYENISSPKSSGTSVEYQGLSSFDYENYLKFADSHLPTFMKSNRQCCCPNLHSELLSMAKTEHEKRVQFTIENENRCVERHQEDMKILRLDKRVKLKKLKLMNKLINKVDEACSIVDEESVKNKTNGAVCIAKLIGQISD